MKEELISSIINLEWKMFSNVSNIGGRASCQENPQTFAIMRASQAMAWSEDVLKSYLEDLMEADNAGINLMTEKYARMMASTSPEEYAQIEHLLPPLDDEKLALIDQIVQINLEWEMEISQKYPYIRKRGRLTNSSEDTTFATSLETYLRGELTTYSLQTLRLYYEDILAHKSAKINGTEEILLNTMQLHGFNSLEEANKELKQKYSGIII